MLQAGARTLQPGAIHDTVAAVLRTAPFRRDFRTTLLARLLLWLRGLFAWLSHVVRGLPGGHVAVIWITALVAAALVARVLLAARARDPYAEPRSGHGARGRRVDPWREADRLASAGEHAAAAHALYRGVLESLARSERLLLHASKTSGDYARELRARRSPAHAPFREFTRRFDDAVYGHGTLDAAATADLVRLSVPLRALARAA